MINDRWWVRRDKWICEKRKWGKSLIWFDKPMIHVQTALQNLGFERIKISCCLHGHGKMIRQLVRSERMSSCVDSRISTNQSTVRAHGHLAAKANQKLLPRHSDLWKCFRKWCTYLSRNWIWGTNIRFHPASHRKPSHQQKGWTCRVLTSWCVNDVFETRNNSK